MRVAFTGCSIEIRIGRLELRQSITLDIIFIKGDISSDRPPKDNITINGENNELIVLTGMKSGRKKLWGEGTGRVLLESGINGSGAGQ